MAGFRFIHAADIHLDSPLKGLAAQGGGAAERIRTATRQALDNLVARTIEEEAAFLVIAGDLYDGDWRDYQTGLFFARQMGRLAAAGIPVFLLYGNHDAESQITRRLALPENVRAFSTHGPESFELADVGVVLHGHGFRDRDVPENLVPGYPEPVAGRFNIGVLHTGLGGMGGHANYAPCALEELVNKGYDYWALGHVHQGVVLHERPHVVFPGNLQGRHVRETGPKGARLVTVEHGEVTDCAPLLVDVARWTVVRVDVADCAGVEEAVDRIRDAIEGAIAGEGEGRLLACRVELTGRSAIHGLLTASVDRLVAEARAAALGLGDEVAWVERLVVRTEPTVDPAALRAREDALGDLRRILGEAGVDAALLEQMNGEFGALVRKLPAEIRGTTDSAVLRAAIDGDFAGLADAAGAYLTARLAADAE